MSKAVDFSIPKQLEESGVLLALCKQSFCSYFCVKAAQINDRKSSFQRAFTLEIISRIFVKDHLKALQYFDLIQRGSVHRHGPRIRSTY